MDIAPSVEELCRKVNNGMNGSDSDVQYCEFIRHSENGWQLCLNSLMKIPPSEETVVFWIVEVLNFTVSSRWINLSGQQQNLVRVGIMSYLNEQYIHTQHPNCNHFILLFLFFKYLHSSVSSPE